MREIAAGLGLSKAALYHHFQDKQTLLLEVLLAGIEQAGGISQRAARTPGGAREKVRALLEGIAAHRGQQRSVMRLAEREAVHLSPADRRDMLASYRARFHAPIEALMRDGQAAGELDPTADAAWLARALLALAQPLLTTTDSATEAAVNSIASLFFDGASARLK